MTLTDTSASSSPTEWNDGMIENLEAIIEGSDSEQMAQNNQSNGNKSTNQEFWVNADSGEVINCVRCEKLGRKKPAELVRFCPYCNQQILVCKSHQRTYSPHGRACALKNYPFYTNNSRIRKTQDKCLEIYIIMQNLEK